jgi:release factor glutamine methyltransferase
VAELPAASVGALLRGLGARIGRLDARLLIEAVCGLRHADLIARPETPVTAAQAERLASLAARRERGEPLPYLLGFAEFRGLRLEVSPAVLVPRPETELLVDWVLELEAGLPHRDSLRSPQRGSLRLQKKSTNAALPFRVLDLGTGSGAIPLALKHARPDWQISAAELSPAALALARRNAEGLGLAIEFFESDWYGNLPPGLQVDGIVSNPPYVAAGDPHLAGDGLRYEPAMALTDFADGLSALRRIVAGAPAYLRDDGILLLEHGYDQGAAVRAMLAKDFYEIETRRDLAGIERTSGGRLKASTANRF